MKDDIIKPEDLRVNSYYFFGYKITKLKVPFCMLHLDELKHVRAIPLIPSMLDMAGFFEHPDKIFIDKSDRFVLRFWDDGSIHVAVKRPGQRVILPNDILTELQYLHELQNLYYFLTWEELNIQL